DDEPHDEWSGYGWRYDAWSTGSDGTNETDGYGYVYVAGIVRGSLHDAVFMGSTSASDMVLIKYHTNDGMRIWTKLLGVADYSDLTYALAIHDQAIYLAGGTAAPELNGLALTGYIDSVLMKFSTSGTLLWTTREGAVDGSAEAYAVAVDTLNNVVYVGGYTDSRMNGEGYNGGSYDMFIIKYDALNGTRLWTRVVGTSEQDEVNGLSVDSSTGDLYVTGIVGGSIDGQTYMGSSTDAAIFKYASNGTRVWTRLLGTAGIDQGIAVAIAHTPIASASAFYVAGVVEGSIDDETYIGARDLFLAQYSLALPLVPSGQPTSQPSRQPTRSQDDGYINTVCQVHTYSLVSSPQTKFKRRRCIRTSPAQ
ncbi:hypothetical protein EON63_21085, partial [archaeon]